RFSPLQQITRDNVRQLQVAWSTHVGMLPPGLPGALEATPLEMDGVVYTCDMHSAVLALDAETGQVRWRFDPKVDNALVNLGICRGVTYYRVSGAKGLCSERIIDTVMTVGSLPSIRAVARSARASGTRAKSICWKGWVRSR